tara:strand:- start:310 stop:510 length:201 start_codon:yes stop_codon:yes gene_type:complete
MQDLLIGQKIQPEVITFLVIHKIKKNEAKKVFLFKKIFFLKLSFKIISGIKKILKNVILFKKINTV